MLKKPLLLLVAGCQMKTYRSKNPDLLFSDVVLDRTPRAIRYFMGYQGDGDLPRKLDRVTAIITQRCNYRCVYCNGPHTGFNGTRSKRKKEMMKYDLSFSEFEKMMSDWKKYVLTQIHFTGGEPTLNHDLPKMVKLATDNGVLAGITTNGSADTAFYKKLIDNGMTEIRISIEADNENDYKKIVGRSGYFKGVMSNIREIVEMRDKKGKDVFLVLNACVGEMNIKKIERLLTFLISLNPDDIKLLVIAMEKEEISKKESREILKRLNDILDRYSKDRFVLLRDKISKLFDCNSMGLKDAETQRIMKHCYIPLTERTITPTHYYPCSIYLRGYGKPLGKLTDSFEEQQKKIIEFVKKHNCRKDRICKHICTNCCKLYNLHVNKEVDKIKTIKVNGVVSEKEVRDVMQKVAKIKPAKNKKWFLIIKPLGQVHKKEIRQFLNNNKIKAIKEVNTKKWREIALPLYRKQINFEKIEFALYREKAFQKIEGNKATILFLESIKNEKIIKDIKNQLRIKFPAPKYLLITRKHREVLEPNTFHIPDEKDLERENGIIKYYLED